MQEYNRAHSLSDLPRRGKIADTLDKSALLWYDIIYMCEKCEKPKRTADSGRKRSEGA